MSFYGGIVLAILSSVLYHFFQKVTPGSVHPIVSLLVSYLVAAALCMILPAVRPPREGFLSALRQLNWTSLALAFAILGIEVGYLLAYRSGWQVNHTALFSSVSVTLLLVPVGIVAFSEKLSPYRVAGMLVCLVGLYLLSHK